MSGETEKQVSGWTVDTIKEYFEQRFTDQDKAVQAALLAAKEAVLKAETATEKRFESVNEFRGQLADQTASLMPRAEADQRFNSMAEKVTDLTDRLNIGDGQIKGSQLSKAGFYTALAAAVGIITLIVVVANSITTS